MQEIETMLSCLAIDCPLEKCIKDCGIEKIRKLSLRERIVHVSKINKIDRHKLLDSHKLCIEKFEIEFYKNLKINNNMDFQGIITSKQS